MSGLAWRHGLIIKKTAVAVSIVGIYFLSCNRAAIKPDKQSADVKQPLAERYYRDPPRSGNIDDYFTPESLQVSIDLSGLRINDTTYDHIGISFRNIRYYDKPGYLEHIVYVYVLEYTTVNGIEYEVTHAIYGTDMGEPYVAGVNKRYRNLPGMIDLGFAAVKRRGDAPTERQAAIFKAAYKAAMSKKKKISRTTGVR
jgi:hypothetical protein